MFKKGLVTLVCLTVMSALWSWATTSYSVQTNIASLGTYDTGTKTADGRPIYAPVIGGSVKIRTLAVGDSIAAKDWATHTGGTKTATVLNTQTVEVDVDAADGYKIGSVYKTTYSIVNGIPVKNAPVLITPLDGPEFHTETIVDQDPFGRTQILDVTFVPKTTDGGNPLNWQLQVQNNNIGGSILVNRGVAGQATYLNQTVSTIGKPWIKNFLDDGKVTLTVSAAPGYKIDYITKNGVKTFLAGNDVSEVVELAGTINSRIKSLNVGYKKISIPVTTHDGATVTYPVLGGGTQTILKDYGILPINPVADPYGVVRLIVTPTANQNKVNSITVETVNPLVDGAFAGTVKYFDRFGTAIPVLGSHIGPVKVTISNITKPIKVTAAYGLDAAMTPAYTNCTQTCHLDQSLAADVKTSLASSDTEWKASAHRSSGVDCVSCHKSMPGPDLSTATAQDTLCATCHINRNEHTAAANQCSVCHTFTGGHDFTSGLNAGVSPKHFGGAFGGNAQYVTQNLSCAACHVTGVAAEVMTAWAESGHADVAGGPWQTNSSHDWATNASCVRCHTGLGFVANVTGTAITQTGGKPGQVLACTTCHTDVAAGAVRPVATYTLPYQIQGSTPDADVITLPGKSGVCLPCHAGRGSGVGITAATAANFNGRFPSHYFNAGASLFAASGYHYAGQTYNQGYHKNIAGEGACVTCHMADDAGKGHTFEAVVKTDGAITAINTAAACASCHADMTPAKLQADKASFIAARETLKAAVQEKLGAFYNAADGGYYTDGTFTTKKTNFGTADAQGAAYNYWLLEHAEAGMYVHNRAYGLKLIADSLEFLNNGTVTGNYTNAELTAAGTDHNLAAATAATCSSCHFTGSAIATSAVSTNHFGGSYGGNAQYVTQNLTCAACHAGDNSGILTEWAESAHGAVDGPAWMTSSSHDWPTYSGGSCKRCHTGIGFVNSIAGTSTTQANAVAGQVLDCASCHSNVAAGEVRTLTGGSFTLPYQIPGTDAAADTISVSGASQVCLPCHAGRGSGVTVTAASAANFNGRFPQHYFGAGASLFNASGYHFSGQTYPQGFHKTIGGDGPCVACHMNSASAGKGHTFEAVTKTDGVVTAINTAAKCATCHTDMTAEKLVASKAAFVAALDVLKAELQSKENAYYNVADGGFYTAADFLTKKTVWSSANALGAANNYWLFEHAEPAAYVHNRGYAMKLIADSIDFLNDGTIDGDSGVTAAASHIAVANADSTSCSSCHNASTYLAVSHEGAFANECVSCHNQAVPAALEPVVTATAAHAVPDQIVVSDVVVTDTGIDADGDLQNEVTMTFKVTKDGQPFDGLTTLFRAYQYAASATVHATTGTDPNTYNVTKDFDRVTLTPGTVAVLAAPAAGQYSVTIDKTAPAGNVTYMVTVAQDTTETKPAATAVGFLNGKAREVVSNDGCFKCHGNNVFGKLAEDGSEWGHHGANPQSVDACVVCHTRYGSVSRGEGGDRTLAYVHGIHNSHNMPAGGYDRQFPTKDGIIDFEIGYPTYMTNCSVCHTTPAQLAAATTAPVSYSLCMSCHDTWDGFGHALDGKRDHTADNWKTDCAGCHAGKTVTDFHNGLMTERSGLIYGGQDVSVVEGAKVDMQISSVTRTGSSLAVVWTASYAGTAVNPCNTTVAANAPVFFGVSANATSGQAAANLSLLRAYAIGDDWANAGLTTSPGQPVNDNITATNTTCAGNVATTTLTLTNAAEVNATGKAIVAIQGKAQVKLPYTFNDPLTPAVEAKDVIQVRSKTPTKEYMIDGSAVTTRREITDTASCLGCHVGSLYQHGGNRIDNVEMCVMCHNEASSEQNVRLLDGVDSTEAYDGKVGQTYGFKSLLHAVHSAGYNDAITMVYRTNGNYVWAKNPSLITNYPIADVFGDDAAYVGMPWAVADDNAAYAQAIGTGSAALIYGSSAAHGTGPQTVGTLVAPGTRSASGTYTGTPVAYTAGTEYQVYRAHNLHVTHYPQALNNCASCHKAGTFGFPDPAKAIATTVNAGTVGLGGSAPSKTASNQINSNLADDTVQGASAAACMSCHNTATTSATGKTKAWYTNHANGGGFVPAVKGTPLNQAEKCAACHK